MSDVQANRLVAATRETVASTAQMLATPPTQDDEDRSLFARLLVRIFIAALAVYLVFLLIQWVAPGGSLNIAAQAEDMIKSVLVPIVTLVLGYYFGQSRKG